MREMDESLEKQIFDLALGGSTNSEICDYLEIDRAELERYAKGLIKARARRKISLRMEQTKAATKGNASMLALLGKDELGQGRTSGGTSAAGKALRPEPELEPKVG